MIMPALLLALLTAGEALARDTVVWVGLDYSFVRMIGTGDFNEPAEIFPGYLEKWNALWIDEMVPEMRSALRADIVVDIDGVTALNRKATSRQIERRDGGRSILDETTISGTMLAEQVRGYTLSETSGTALVIVVDRLVKLQESGCSWVVWFDVSSRRIQSQARMCKEASGFGFRNYWFHPLKDLVPELRATRR